MNRRAMLALLLAAALLLSGCSLARPETEADAAQNEDPMVGVLVTLEPLDLFDFEAYFNDNAASLAKGGEVSAQDAEKYQNVLFAEQDGDGRYVFPEVEGYLILCTRRQDGITNSMVMQSDPVFCTSENHVASGDTGGSYTFAATIYCMADDSGIAQFYTNPLYQTADGRVYAASGSGMSTNTDGEATPAMTARLSQTVSVTDNGETTEQSFEAAITYQIAARPVRTDVYWMCTETGVLKHEQYASGEFPKQLDARGAEFLIIVETGEDGSARRTLCEPGTNSGQAFVLAPAADGMLIAQYSDVLWE